MDALSDPAITIITAQELIAGARDKRDLAGIDSFVATCAIEHLDAAIGLSAYELLKKYAKSDGLRTFDSLIAATAMERGLVLVTRNRKHFASMDCGLRFRSTEHEHIRPRYIGMDGFRRIQPSEAPPIASKKLCRKSSTTIIRSN